MTEETEGYTQVPNNILEALAFTQLPGKQSRLVNLILRETHGWADIRAKRIKSKRITYTRMAEKTGMNRWDCHKMIVALLERKIVGKNSNDFFINPNTQEWRGALEKTPTKASLEKSPISVRENSNEIVGENPNIERNKQRLKKENTPEGASKPQKKMSKEQAELNKKHLAEMSKAVTR